MNFALASDQEMVRKSAREFFVKECPKEKVRELKNNPQGYDPKMWKKMMNLGYMGITIPEKYGGTAGEFLELTVFLEEMGRNIVPSPYFSTVVLCSLPLLKFGNQAQKETLLPQIAEKGEIWAFAQLEQLANQEPTDIRLQAVLTGDDYILQGTKLFVPYANVAQQMLVVARTSENKISPEGITVFIVDTKQKGIQVEIMPTTARDCRCEVNFDNVRIPSKNILGKLDKGWEIVEDLLSQAAVLKAAEMSGGAQAVLEIAINYTRERYQFGKAIGSFQAIQHRLVDLLTEVEGLKYLVYQAAWKINCGSPSKMLSSMAKAKANNVYHKVCYQGMVMHGAIGWTEEMDLGLYHLRTKASEFDCGGSDIHLERIAQELRDDQPDFTKLFA